MELPSPDSNERLLTPPLTPIESSNFSGFDEQLSYENFGQCGQNRRGGRLMVTIGFDMQVGRNYLTPPSSPDRQSQRNITSRKISVSKHNPVLKSEIFHTPCVGRSASRSSGRGRCSRISYGSLSSPDRFVPSRHLAGLATQKFRSGKTAQQLTSAECLLRNDAASPDVFGPHRVITNQVPASSSARRIISGGRAGGPTSLPFFRDPLNASNERQVSQPSDHHNMHKLTQNSQV